MRITVCGWMILACLLATAGVSASTIHQAAAKGDSVLVKTLIKNNPSLVKEKDDRDVTPLHYASFYGRTPVVSFLISAGAPVDAVTKSGYTPLLWAAWRKHFAVVKILVASGSDINAKADNGMTSLHFAVQNSDRTMAEYLLSIGCKTTIKDNLGRTPLEYARKLNSKGLVKVLSAANTKTAVSRTQNTLPAPKTNSVVAGEVAALRQTPVVIASVDAPEPVLPTGEDKVIIPRPTPEKPSPKTIKPIKPEPLVLVRSFVLDIAKAASENKPEALKYMLDRQPGLLTATDSNGATVMHWLAELDWAEGIRLFAMRGGSISSRKLDGVTPLHIAAAMGKLSALDTLLELGADRQLTDIKGRTALDIATERGQSEAADRLRTP